MNSRKKIWAIATVGALLIAGGIVAASAAVSGNGSSPLTLTPTPGFSSTSSSINPIVPGIPLPGVAGSERVGVNSDDDATSDLDDHAFSSTSSASSDDAGDDDSVSESNSLSSDDAGDDDSDGSGVTQAGASRSFSMSEIAQNSETGEGQDD
ncbi:MAG: hypothetical protein NTX12_03690 [Actinobacteria bacterium]|nr:hypothetical protein [Actinomycetota bacterium]